MSAQDTVNADVPATDGQQVVAEPGYKVFAGNLTYATDEAALKNFFAPFADDILSAQIILRTGRSAGYGFVTMKTDATVDRAVQELDKKELDGRPVIVERAKPLDEKRERTERRSKPRKFGGRRGSKAVPGEATEPKEGDAAQPAVNGDVAAAADAQPPKPKKKKSPKKKKGPKPEATADGVDGTLEPAAAAAEGEAVPATTKPKRVRKPREPKEHHEKRPRGEQPPGEPSTSVLFVANLAFSVDEAQLTDWFTAAGVVVRSARVVRWKWGTPRKSKGYAFVDVGDEAEQQKAIGALSGKSLADREVTIRVAVNSKDGEHEEGAAGEAVVPAATEAVAAAA